MTALFPRGLRVNPERIISRLLDLMKIDSESGKEAEVGKYLRNVMNGLGLEVVEDRAGERIGGDCGNILVRVPANKPRKDSPGLLLNAHMDTVAPGIGVVPEIRGGVIRSVGDTVLGADDKVGVAVLIELANTLIEKGYRHPYMELLFTVGEENALRGTKELDLSSLKCEYGYVLDGPGDVGGIVLEAPAHETVRVVIKGQAAHAGVEPEKGSSAIQCAAKAIASVELGRIDSRTTVNIGAISGGRAINIVPDNVVVEGEVRSLEEERLVEEREKMISSFERSASSSGCEVKIDVSRSFESFHVNIDSYPVRLLIDCMKEFGVTPRFLTSGGGSDNNILAQSGKSLVTMSTGMINPHSTDESIREDDVRLLANILLRVIIKVSKSGFVG